MPSTARPPDPPWISPAEEAEYIIWKGRRLWFSWEHDRRFGVVLGIINHRKQQVKSVVVGARTNSSRRYWYVRRIPVGPVEPTPAPMALIHPVAAPICEARRGSWVCYRETHRHDPNRHVFRHQPEEEAP